MARSTYRLRASRNKPCLLPNVLYSPLRPTPVSQTEEIVQFVHGYLQRLRQGFANALGSARTAGDLGAEKDPDVLADFLVGAVMGLSAMARAGRPRKQIMHYIDTTLATLG